MNRCTMRIATGQNQSVTCGSLARHTLNGTLLCRRHARQMRASKAERERSERAQRIAAKALIDWERRLRKRKPQRETNHAFVFSKPRGQFKQVTITSNNKTNPKPWKRPRGFALREDRGYCSCGWRRSRPVTKQAWRNHYRKWRQQPSPQR